jgi:O-antigen/teichoic acid export membrane protein
MTHQKRNPLMTDAFGTLAVRVAGIVLMFVSTTVAARLLGPSEYGTYSAAQALAVLLASLAPLGSEQLLVRNLSITKGVEEAGRETAIAHVCAIISGLVLVIAALATWSVCNFVLDESEWARTVLLATMLFVPSTVVLMRQWLAIPVIGSRQAAIPEQTIMPFLLTVSLFLMAAAGWKTGAVAGVAAHTIVMVVVGFGSIRIGPIHEVYRSAWNSVRSLKTADIRRQFRAGLPFLGVGIGSRISQSSVPLLIAATCGFRETACYTLAFPYAILASLPLSAFNVTMISRCARHFRAGEFSAASHAVRSSATVTVLLAAAMGLVIWVCSPLLAILLGSEFSVVSRLLPPLLLAVIVDSMTGPTVPVMQTMKMEKTYAWALFAYIPVLWCLIFSFSRIAGVEGAACAYLISRCLWNFVVVAVIYRQRGLLMLPYLTFTHAFRENRPFSKAETSDRSVHRHWHSVPISESSVTQRSAA